jgi:hypothetical protein
MNDIRIGIPTYTEYTGQENWKSFSWISQRYNLSEVIKPSGFMDHTPNKNFTRIQVQF